MGNGIFWCQFFFQNPILVWCLCQYLHCLHPANDHCRPSVTATNIAASVDATLVPTGWLSHNFQWINIFLFVLIHLRSFWRTMKITANHSTSFIRTRELWKFITVPPRSHMRAVNLNTEVLNWNMHSIFQFWPRCGKPGCTSFQLLSIMDWRFASDEEAHFISHYSQLHTRNAENFKYAEVSLHHFCI